MTNAVLELRDIYFAFPDKSPCFQGLSLQLAAGNIAVISGASGAGKSTLLKLINMLHMLASGEIYFKDQNIRSMPATALRARMPFMANPPVVFAGTVKENILLPLSFKAHSSRPVPDDTHLKEMMERLLLDDVSLQAPALQLSSGQRQRISLLRTLILKPELLLLDEPTSALDPKSKDAVEHMLLDVCRKENSAILLVSHLPFHKRSHVIQNYILKDGRLQAAEEGI